MQIRVAIALTTSLALLAGCYGGVTLGFGPGDDPPSVNLAATASSAAPGDRIGLVAAASDDYRVVEVAFYRIDAGGSTLLARDTSEPYSVETSVPANASDSVRYFARARDDAGHTGDSAEVVITVLR